MTSETLLDYDVRECRPGLVAGRVVGGVDFRGVSVLVVLVGVVAQVVEGVDDVDGVGFVVVCGLRGVRPAI